MDNQWIEIKGLKQNNLKNISLKIPKNKIVVFTGVSGSGKSSLVFDTIVAESQRQMNETYSAWIKGRLAKYEKPQVEHIHHLNPSVVIDQSQLGGNVRSTVGTISDIYSSLRLLFSRIGTPQVGPASYFSFNNPHGMCPTCFGIGKVMDLDIFAFIDENKSYDEGMFRLPAFNVGKYYWKLYRRPDLFSVHTQWKDLSSKEKNFLLYGSCEKNGERIDQKIEGIYHHFKKLCFMKDQKDPSIIQMQKNVIETICPSCHGQRLHPVALSSKIQGYHIAQMCEMELSQLKDVLLNIKDKRASSIIEHLVMALDRMIDIGLPYLSLNRESSTLSGGEAQRLKLVRYMGSDLTQLIYIFDEPSSGMHPRDVHRIIRLMKNLRDKGNTILVVEHDKDIISAADYIIDVGPLAGRYGGEIVFEGSYQELLKTKTKTALAMKQMIPVKDNVRLPKGYLSIQHANLHNLKDIHVHIPLGVLTVVTGVAGSGKSTLIREVFVKTYQNQVVVIDQKAIMATGRSNLCTFMGFFDDIRELFAKETRNKASLFSFNSQGGCYECKGKGTITTELIFLDPVTCICESCGGDRYNQKAKQQYWRGKNIVDVLNMSVEEAALFFEKQSKIKKQLDALMEVGLSYLSLGQSLSTLSGGERQRVKLAKNMFYQGNIFILDEPTNGLHACDVETLMKLFDQLVEKGHSVIIIEHHVDVIKRADYIIDVGPEGGTKGGEIVFCGTVRDMIEHSHTITAQYLRKSINGANDLLH